jgi:hypothetical protein
MQPASSGDLPGWKCQDCLKCFSDKTSFVSHMKFIHGRFVAADDDEDDDDSDEEGAIDASNPLALIIKNLTEAAARKAAKTSGSVRESCNFCDKTFSSQAELSGHIINVHIKGFCLSCDLCGKSFLQQDKLDAHTRAKHPNVAKRAKNLRSALGIDAEPSSASPAKRPRLEGTYKLLLSLKVYLHNPTVVRCLTKQQK